MRHTFKRCAATLLLAVALEAPLPAAAADYTDIWYNPAESGWGVNLVQGENVLFATFFVYDPARQPTWYVAVLTNDGTGVYSGSVLATSGPYLGAPWDGVTTNAIVGDATFRPTAADAATLTYNIGPAPVTKSILRQTLKTIVLGGDYIGGVAADQFSCSNPLGNVSARRSADIAVTQTVAGDGRIDLAVAGGPACSISGTLVQRGQLYSMIGARYVCNNGLDTHVDVTELHATAQGIEGRWAGRVAGGCTEQGSFAAVLK